MAPVLADPTRLAIGHEGNDVWNHVWGYWYVYDALSQGRLPLETELLRWPVGGSLWFIDTVGAVLTLPLQWAWGPVAAYNAALAFNLWLCGFGAFVLARQVTGSWWGGLLAGLCYMSAPHFLGQAYNGISETLAAGWLPLAIAGLRQLFRAPSLRTGLVAGLFMGLNTVANWYYGLFGAMVLAGLLGRELWRLIGARDPQGRVLALARAGLPGAALSVAIAGPPFALFAASMGAEQAVVGRDPDFVWMTLVMHNMTDAVALLRPGQFQSPDLKALFDEDLLVVVYVGMALLGPALGVLTSSRARQARPWALLALGFLLLTLGPFLFVGGDYVSLAGGWIPLPFLALFEWTPIFSRISHAYRFVVGLTLALSVIVAWMVPLLQARRVPPWLAVALLGGLRIGEAVWMSPVPMPLPVVDTTVPAVLAQLDDVDPGAVLDLPVSLPVLRRSRYGMGQLAHGLPGPYGLNDPTPLSLYLNHYTHLLIEIERGGATYLPARLPALDLAAGQAALVAQGLRWIVVHEDLMPDSRRAPLEALLDATAEAVYDGDGLRIYRLR
jgi:hypothetical protein